MKESDDGLACTGFKDKLRERRAKINISSGSDVLLVILSEIDDTYRTRTIYGVATLRLKFTISSESYTRKSLSEIPNPVKR